MTRPAGLPTLLLALALLGACGKYGAPLRASEAQSVRNVTAAHPADCQDPEHEHDAHDAAGEETP